MDKQKATKLLVRELVKADGQKFVTDTAHKKHLLEKALSCYHVKHEEPFSFKSNISWPYGEGHIFHTDSYDKGIRDYRKNLIKHCINVNDANYVFVEHTENLSFNSSYSLLYLTDMLSFFALIGDEESEKLKRMFYKDVDPEIVRAMNTLGIEHLMGSYKSYKEDSYFLGYYREKQSPDNFLELVFTIPYEDQVLENNKGILQRFYYHIDFVEVLTREYSNGIYFQDYFNCLDSGNKKLVFDNLKNLKERNPINDSFLWANGFKELKLDHLELYKDNAKNFIDYFNNRNLEEKKVILKDIMNYDSTNEEVIKWLNENYLDLVREVGFDG